jgi:hypothetical protein
MKIEMKHGAGGSSMEKLLRDVIISNLSTDGIEVPLSYMDDSSVVDGIAFTQTLIPLGLTSFQAVI